MLVIAIKMGIQKTSSKNIFKYPQYIAYGSFRIFTPSQAAPAAVWAGLEKYSYSLSDPYWSKQASIEPKNAKGKTWQFLLRNCFFNCFFN